MSGSRGDNYRGRGQRRGGNGQPWNAFQPRPGYPIAPPHPNGNMSGPGNTFSNNMFGGPSNFNPAYPQRDDFPEYQPNISGARSESGLGGGNSRSRSYSNRGIQGNGMYGDSENRNHMRGQPRGYNPKTHKELTAKPPPSYYSDIRSRQAAGAANYQKPDKPDLRKKKWSPDMTFQDLVKKQEEINQVGMNPEEVKERQAFMEYSCRNGMPDWTSNLNESYSRLPDYDQFDKERRNWSNLPSSPLPASVSSLLSQRKYVPGIYLGIQSMEVSDNRSFAAAQPTFGQNPKPQYSWNQGDREFASTNDKRAQEEEMNESDFNSLEKCLKHFVCIRRVNEHSAHNIFELYSQLNRPNIFLHIETDVVSSLNDEPATQCSVKLNDFLLMEFIVKGSKKTALAEARERANILMESKCPVIQEDKLEIDNSITVRLSDIREGKWWDILHAVRQETKDFNNLDPFQNSVGKKLMGKMGWKEGERLGSSSSCSNFDAQRIALETRVFTAGKSVVGCESRQFQKELASMLEDFASLKGESRPLCIPNVSKKTRAEIHTLANANAANLKHESKVTNDCIDDEKTVFISHKMTPRFLLKAIRKHGGKLNQYSLISDVEFN